MRKTLALFAAALAACGSDQYTLTVEKAGTGTGSVSGTGIACGGDCTEKFSKDAIVELTASADSGSTLQGWGSCDSVNGNICLVTMNADRRVQATFTLATGPTWQLTVQKTGNGGGTVTGTGINCGTDCTEAIANGGVLTLTATPDGTSTLASWTGCDSASGNTCALTMTADRTVTANFAAATGVVTVSGDITAPTTWTTGTTYHVTVPISVTAPLTIQPGVVVRLDSDTFLYATAPITADGGSADTPVIFTSSSPSPQPGAWPGIALGASGSVFNHCQVLYAGEFGQSALSIGPNVAATVTNCTFAHHQTSEDGLEAPAALDASEAAAGTVIAQNLFFHDVVPLAANTTFSIGPNTFDNSAAAPSNPQPSRYNAIVVSGCGHVTGNVTWPPQPVAYVIGNPSDACNYVVVDNGAQLSVGSAGGATTAVKFFEGGRISASGVVNANQAVFTSIEDDRYGGDTNASTIAPAPGQWRGISLAKAGSFFDHVIFAYAGGDNGSALDLGAYAATVTNSVFAYNQPTGDGTVRAPPALDASAAPANAVIGTNLFYGNTVPLAMNTTLSIDDSNAFSAVVNAATVGNTYNAIVVSGCGQVTTNVTWSAVKVPLVIGNPVDACNYIGVSGAGHLTLADGVVVKLFPFGRIEVNGILTANAATGIVFTSFKDDAHGGDTNADVAATAPAGGDWNGLWVRSSGSVFNRVQFLYGGGLAAGQDASSLSLSDGHSITITNCVFAHSRCSTTDIGAPAALDLTGATATGTVLQNNRFFDDTVPLAVNATLSVDDTNAFDSGVPAVPQHNQHDGILVDGCGAVTGGTTWLETSVPFVIGNPYDACNYLNVTGTGHLAIGPNVTLKFFLQGRVTVSAGASMSIDPAAYLTAWSDDHCTDTNDDHGAVSPHGGDWYGIKYLHQNTGATCEEGAFMHFHTPGCTW